MNTSTPQTTSNDATELGHMTDKVSHLAIFDPNEKIRGTQNSSFGLVSNSSSPTPQNTTPNTFTCFPRLPIELRLAIFSLIPRPRQITIREVDEHSVVVKARPYTPVLLHVNSESRLLMQERYRVGFEAGILNPMYYHPKRDVIMSKGTKPLQRFRMLAVMDHARFRDEGYKTDFHTFVMRIHKDYLRISGEVELGVTLGRSRTDIEIKMRRGLYYVRTAFGRLRPVHGKTMVFVHIGHLDEAFAKKTSVDFFDHLTTKEPELSAWLAIPNKTCGEYTLAYLPKVVHMTLADFEAQYA